MGREDTGEEVGTYACTMSVPNSITCVECGGTANRVSFEPHEGFEPGDVVVFACEDCNHRLDVVIEQAEFETSE
jgi:hypothetical protein